MKLPEASASPTVWIWWPRTMRSSARSACRTTTSKPATSAPGTGATSSIRTAWSAGAPAASPSCLRWCRWLIEGRRLRAWRDTCGRVGSLARPQDQPHQDEKDGGRAEAEGERAHPCLAGVRAREQAVDSDEEERGEAKVVQPAPHTARDAPPQPRADQHHGEGIDAQHTNVGGERAVWLRER